ncbi:FAD-linked oxidoreductase [Mycobacterium leprae Kyoto-2]|uniref:FAD-linked oxidoreductase n=3 Tax=Mycobacterium leprae TaxID=1769 RepID=Q9CBA6_MYCLE|nr:menaquinone reductase [Mycobacterium leprae]CAR72374.1 putative FAD-linked oxidoreductase [Mycobacterium leprae Br4923]AWV48573.1 NAD(P)/FAD-dependent oxidoreductase [Mycobacterium leprae]OAR21168.1 FAD-linked oxidoreductase [Mycobacterium leprae 3125609]OAX72164.1 FAD-linked oxidoreductase [Mycobacterium leprae 7935681]CAC31792.1 putative FAD-linked oxidoreductase [Mycobacterium leprae]
MRVETSADVVVVGAGPAGSAAATWAARAGNDVIVIDSVCFPRDKACGDGLTPRAVAELKRLGLDDWLNTRIRHRGLRMSGFGGEVEVDWPGPSFPSTSSAVPRLELDDRIRKVAENSGARMLLGTKAVSVYHDSSRRAASVTLADGTEVGCRQLIIADGARSPLGRKLGRSWHQKTVYGVAARGYLTTPRSDDLWLTSHLELRSPDGAVLPGYGWIFPLGNGEVNIGVGALSTSKRPADLALRSLISYYTDLRRHEWGFSGQPRAVSSALLPMGGAVSGVAGPNWMLIGDAAACVNPLNGEGIDYGLETGRLAAELLDLRDLSYVWPSLLQQHYGRGFSVARRLALLLTFKRCLPAIGPSAMRSTSLITIAVRVMANLVTDDDADWVARVWRSGGWASWLVDRRPPFS